MAEPKNNISSQDVFTKKVVPIMDKVRNNLQQKMADEYRTHASSMSSILASSIGPDGGMSMSDATMNTLRYTGKWNSKTVDDYIEMVKAELKRQNIKVDAVMEKKMIDYLVRQQMPKSTAEYILRKAAEGTIFYVPQRTHTTSLQAHINNEGEKLHNPSLLEDIAGNVLSWAANAGTTAGLGGTWGQIALDATVEANDHFATGQADKFKNQQKKKALNEVFNANKKRVNVPDWMYAQMGITSLNKATDKQLAIAVKWADDNAKRQRNAVKSAVSDGERTIKYGGKTKSVSDAVITAKQYEAFSASIKQEQLKRQERIRNPPIAEAEEQYANQVQSTNTDQNSQSSMSRQSVNNVSSSQSQGQGSGDYSGWNNLLGSMGLEGIGDTVNHLGVTLAMLPDMLVGIFTGKTKSIGLNKGTLFPLAAILSGTFIKNPLLKLPLMLWGGANLVNKMGQEALQDYIQGETVSNTKSQDIQYKRYDDQQLSPRINDPRIEGNVIVMDIDNVPRIITLPSNTVSAYQAGALPLNTLANAILAKSDQISNAQELTQHETQSSTRRHEQKMEREQGRGIR